MRPPPPIEIKNRSSLYAVPDRVKLILIITPDKSQIRLVGVHANLAQSSGSSCTTPGKHIYHWNLAWVGRVFYNVSKLQAIENIKIYKFRETFQLFMIDVEHTHILPRSQPQTPLRDLWNLIKPFVSSFFARVAEKANRHSMMNGKCGGKRV